LQILKELQSLKQISGPDPNYNDICFSGAGMYVCYDKSSHYSLIAVYITVWVCLHFSVASQLSKSFPVVDMVFGNGDKYSLSPENYMFRVSHTRLLVALAVFTGWCNCYQMLMIP